MCGATCSFCNLFIQIFIYFLYIYQGAQTGCSMNPFRALWPAVAANHWHYAFIPMAVPVGTAILLALAWRFLYVSGRDEKYNENYDEWGIWKPIHALCECRCVYVYVWIWSTFTRQNRPLMTEVEHRNFMIAVSFVRLLVPTVLESE